LKTKKGESSKPKKAKKAEKKEQPDRDIFTQGRGLVKLSGEIKDAERALKFVRQYKDVIAPEAKSFMWADLPHPYLFVDKGLKQRVKLGELSKNFSKDRIQGNTLYEKDKYGKPKFINISSSQQTLLDFVIGDSKYDGSKRKNFDFLKGTGLSKEDYALHVESIAASVLNRKDGMLKPLGNMSIDKDGDQRREDIFGGFQAEKGTNYFLFAVHKAAKMEAKKGRKPVKLISDNPTMEELAMYEVANGKAYEDRGGSYENRMQFRYFNLIERMSKEAQSKIKALGKAYGDLEPSDPQREAIMTSIKNLTDYQEKLFPSVDDIANYAEENQYFPKVQAGKMFSDAFTEWLYYDEMLKAVNKYLDYVESDLKGGFNPQLMEADINEEDLKSRGDKASILKYLKARKAEYEQARNNAEETKEKKKKEQKELFSGLNIDLGIDQGETTFEESEDGTLYVSPEGVVGRTLKQTGYDYREIDEGTDEDIAPREGVHGGFKRREVDRGFDIMAVLREIAATNPDAKELKERLKTLVPSRYETTFLTEFVRPEPKTRITYNHDGQDRTVEWRENEWGEGYWVGGTLGPYNKALTDKYTLSLINDAWMSQVDKEVLQSAGDPDMVTAAKLADFLLRGNSVSDLGMIPSSKTEKDKRTKSGEKILRDMTGGPGGGMLPFVFEAFIKEMYQRLNIKDFETEVTVSEFIDPIKTKTAKVKVNGIDATLIVDENGMAAVYSKDSDGEAMRTIDVPKDEVEKLVQEKFGKDTKAVVADLKKEDEPEAEGQKPTEKAKAVGKKYKYIEDTKAEDFEKWKNDASTAVDHISESEDIDSSYSISRKEYSDYLKDLIDNGFGYETDKRNNDPMGTEAIKESDRWAETNKKSSTEKPKAEGQKPKEQAKGQRKYKKVTLKYSANQWFVDRELVKRSLFAEGAKHPEFDYMQAALAPIIQAVVDARRVDIFNTGKRNEKIVNPRDTSYDPNSEKGEDGAPEGSNFDDQDETDNSKDGAKLDQKDLEQESKDGDEFKTFSDNEPIPLNENIAVNEAILKKLKPTGKDKSDPEKVKFNTKLYNLKKYKYEYISSVKPGKDNSSRRKVNNKNVGAERVRRNRPQGQKLTVEEVAEAFKNDNFLWDTFDMPRPKLSVMDSSPFATFVKEIKKHINFALFDRHILSPRSQALGASFNRRGFLKSLVMGAAASNLKMTGKMAGAEPVKMAKVGYSALAKQVKPILELFGRVEVERNKVLDLELRSNSSMRQLEDRLAASLMDRDSANPPPDTLDDEQYDSELEGVIETLDKPDSPVKLFGLKPHDSDFISPFYEPIPGKKLALSGWEQESLLKNLEAVVEEGTQQLKIENLYQDLFEAKRKWNLMYLKTGDPVVLNKARETQDAIDILTFDSAGGRDIARRVGSTTSRMEDSAKYLGVPLDFEEFNKMSPKQLEKVAKNMGFLQDIIVEAESYDAVISGSVDPPGGVEAFDSHQNKPLDPKVVKKLIQVQGRHDNKEIKEELKRAVKALKIVAGYNPTGGSKPKLSDNTKKILQAAQGLISAAATKAKKEADKVANKVTDEVVKAVNEPLALENEAVKNNEINIEPETQSQGEKVERRGSQGEALGSSYSLSSGIPDNYGKLSILSRLASKAGVSEEDKEKYKKILSGFDFKTSLVDQADPPKQMVANFLKSVGIKDQALIDAIDVHGKWHQYYGKGYNTVEQSQIRFIEPIKDAMAKHGVTNSMLGEYLLARAAPSRNMHLKEMYQAELKTMEEGSKEYKALQDMLSKRENSLSGIHTEDAKKRIKEMEAMDPIKNFILDENNPLQLFYDMNREALMLKSESGLIRQQGDINEAKAMILAMSKYNINNISRARMNDNYNYAPMQGFEGETEKLFDNEMAYEAVGKSSTAAGRGWDQPKHAFLQNGAFGRTNTNIGPDPETVFAAAQSQYFDAAIRSHKNEVSNAFGKVYELMRAIAYPDKDGELSMNVDLPDELKNLSPDVKKKVKAEFDQIFEKEFKELDTKKDYEIQEKDIEVDGQKIDGLKMVRRTLSTKFQNDPYVFVYRKDGVPHFIKFKGEPGARMAASLKNLRYESLPRILQLINKMTRFMAQMFTSMNPAFIIPNFIRDVGTAAIHLSEDDKKNMVGKTLSGKRLGKFMKAIFKVEQSLSKGENIKTDLDINEVSAMQLLREGDHQKMYQFAKQAGAKIGYFRHKSMPELIDDARTNKAKDKKGVKARLKSVSQLVESMNTAVENSIRMSAFWSAIETGRSVHQAASISRNVTVDFNQKGNLTQAFGSLFVFFGASTNSAHRFARTLHKRGKVGSGKLIGGIIAASFAVALFNRLIDDDEDEEMPDYDTITHFKRDTNLLLPLPGNIPGLEDKTGRDTGYFGIPVPLGYNVFWALGQTTADFFAKYVMGRGGAGGMEFFTRNLEAGLNAFNPIGGATLQTALVPTAGKPIVEMYANKNFMGTEIRKSDVPYEAPKPAHMMDQKRTQQHWTDLSRFINKTLGGNDEIKGSIGGLFGGNPLLSSEDSDYRFDLSGSEMEHLALGYLGGPGQIINMFFGDGVYPAIDDKEYNLDINKMPVVNRFIRTSTYGSATRRSYYQIREAAMIAKKAVEAAKKKGGAEFATMQKNQKPLIDIMPQIKAMDGKRSKLRDMKNKIENSKTFTKSQKMQRIEELERKELNMITAVIKKAQSLGIS
jgi:hypothetical protein